MAERVSASGRWPEPGSDEEWLALAGGCLPGRRGRRALPVDINGLIGTRPGRGLYSRRWQRLLEQDSPDALLVRTVASAVAGVGPNVERATKQALTLLPRLAAGEVGVDDARMKARFAALQAPPRRSERYLEVQAAPRWVEATRARSQAVTEADRDHPPTVLDFLRSVLDRSGRSGLLNPEMCSLIEADWAVACNHLTAMGMSTGRTGEALLAAARSTSSTHEHRLGRELTDGRLARLFVGTAKGGCQHALAWWWGQWTLGRVQVEAVPDGVVSYWARLLTAIASSPPASVSPLFGVARERARSGVAHRMAV